MSEAGTVSLVVELDAEQAEALAQLVKRVGLSNLQPLAASEAESYAMQAGLERVREALRQAGYAPR